jgi:hypothetical protein
MASNLLTVIENETIKSKTIKTEKFGNIRVHIQGIRGIGAGFALGEQ